MRKGNMIIFCVNIVLKEIKFNYKIWRNINNNSDNTSKILNIFPEKNQQLSKAVIMVMKYLF